MIPFDFTYHRPETVEEAVALFAKISAAGQKPIYYGGGTEFISMARLRNVQADAVIDLKGIPECCRQEVAAGELVLGAGVTLSAIAETDYFPLLTKTVKRIADHTIQEKITLGGNLAGTIIYREGILPLLAADGEVVLAQVKGRRRVPLRDVFDRVLKLAPGEMIVQAVVKADYLKLPFAHAKRTKNEKIDYPLITLAALKNGSRINLAFSGLCQYPLRSLEMEDAINQGGLLPEARIEKAVAAISGQVQGDLSGSAEYRRFVLGLMLDEALKRLGEVN